MAKVEKVTYKDGDVEKAIVIKKPNHTQLTEANMYSASIFNRARLAGAVLRGQLDDWLEDQKIWDKEHRDKIRKLEASINEKLKILNTGKNADGTKVKLTEARKIAAIEIPTERWTLNFLLAKRREYDTYTVEGQSENARFDHLASTCLYDEEGNRLFKNIDEYFEACERDEVSDAASRLANMIYGTDNWEKNLPENQFLKKFKMVDDNWNYINKEGKRVDAYGNPIEEVKEVVEEEATFEDDLT
jgi:hypothetical protein